RPSTSCTTPCNAFGMRASVALAYAIRPCLVRTFTMLVWNAACTVDTGASPDTSRWSDVTWILWKPCWRRNAFTWFTCASPGPYLATNSAWVRFSWWGLAMSAFSSASLRQCNDSVTRIVFVSAIGPATASPARSRVASWTTDVLARTAGVAAKAAEPAARPMATTRAFNRRLLGITELLLVGEDARQRVANTRPRDAKSAMHTPHPAARRPPGPA